MAWRLHDVLAVAERSDVLVVVAEGAVAVVDVDDGAVKGDGRESQPIEVSKSLENVSADLPIECALQALT